MYFVDVLSICTCTPCPVKQKLEQHLIVLEDLICAQFEEVFEFHIRSIHAARYSKVIQDTTLVSMEQ